MRTRLCLAILFCIASVAFAGTVKRRVAFNEADFTGYGGTGTATIQGKLVVSTESGLHEGNGVSVELVPVNAYTEEMVDMELANGILLSPKVDPRFKKYARIVTTDYHGNFVIQGVPAGHYFICGEVDYLILGQTDYDGQWAVERITVGKGETLKLNVSKNPNHGHDIQMIETLR